MGRGRLIETENCKNVYIIQNELSLSLVEKPEG